MSVCSELCVQAVTVGVNCHISVQAVTVGVNCSLCVQAVCEL